MTRTLVGTPDPDPDHELLFEPETWDITTYASGTTTQWSCAATANSLQWSWQITTS